MSYEDIAKELQVSRDEAEQYIVKAVQSGLVEGWWSGKWFDE